LAAGKPVPLVAVSLGDAMGRQQPALNLDGKTFKDSLSAIADAYSDRLAPNAGPTRRLDFEASHETLVPYAFGQVWTIGRDHQWQFNEHPNVPDVLDAVAPGDLLPRLVCSLSDAQLRKATSSGLQFDDFNRQQQAVLHAAFRAPATLFTRPGVGADGADQHETMDSEGVVPIEQCSLGLNLAFRDIYMQMEAAKQPTQFLYSYSLDNAGKMMFVEGNPAAAKGYTFPLMSAVPAKLKPGDLAFDDKALDAAIGVSGIIRLDKAVEAAAKATGLALRVDPRFSGDNVDGPPVPGFAAPERAAFIKEHSIDPGDFSESGSAPVNIPTFSARGYGNDLDNAWATVRMKEDAALLKDLNDEAERAWPGRVHLFSALDLWSKEETDPFPKPDISIRSRRSALPHPESFAWFAPAPDIVDGLPDKDGKVMDRITDLIQRVKRLTEFQARAKRPSNAGMVLDFRAAPSLLWNGLARLAGPAPAVEPVSVEKKP
jgi:hypothetical protein